MQQFADLAEIIWRSFYISILGTLIAFVLAAPLAYYVARHQFRGRFAFNVLMQALMAMPPVVVGLSLYVFFRPSGFFGGFGWLYGNPIMVLAQTVLVFPIVYTLSLLEFEKVEKRLRPYFDAFEPNLALEKRVMFFEARLSLLTAFLTGFGRAIGEVGAVMIVGGNLQNRTEVMTTFIVEETGKGNLDDALKLGFVLVAMAVLVSTLSLMMSRNWEKS